MVCSESSRVCRHLVKASEFHWTRGEDLVRYFESSPGTHRGFCTVCGSNLVSHEITDSLPRFEDVKPWGAMEFAILDPDGNLITFHENTDTKGTHAHA